MSVDETLPERPSITLLPALSGKIGMAALAWIVILANFTLRAGFALAKTPQPWLLIVVLIAVTFRIGEFISKLTELFAARCLGYRVALTWKRIGWLGWWHPQVTYVDLPAENDSVTLLVAPQLATLLLLLTGLAVSHLAGFLIMTTAIGSSLTLRIARSTFR